MSATRGMLRSLADTCKSPAEVLNKLNRLMVESDVRLVDEFYLSNVIWSIGRQQSDAIQYPLMKQHAIHLIMD